MVPWAPVHGILEPLHLSNTVLKSASQIQHPPKGKTALEFVQLRNPKLEFKAFKPHLSATPERLAELRSGSISPQNRLLKSGQKCSWCLI